MMAMFLHYGKCFEQEGILDHVCLCVNAEAEWILLNVIEWERCSTFCSIKSSTVTVAIPTYCNEVWQISFWNIFEINNHFKVGLGILLMDGCCHETFQILQRWQWSVCFTFMDCGLITEGFFEFIYLLQYTSKPCCGLWTHCQDCAKPYNKRSLLGFKSSPLITCMAREFVAGQVSQLLPCIHLAITDSSWSPGERELLSDRLLHDLFITQIKVKGLLCKEGHTSSFWTRNRQNCPNQSSFAHFVCQMQECFNFFLLRRIYQEICCFYLHCVNVLAVDLLICAK